MIFGTVAYTASTAAFLLLTALLIAGWQGRQPSGHLVVATVLTSAWAGLLAIQAATELVPPAYVYLAEICRGAAWLVALTALARGTLPRFLTIVSRIVWVGVLAVIALVVVSPLGDRLELSLIFSRGALAIAVVGLIVLEQLYRNADSGARPALRYFLLGVGGLFAYDVFLYSQAELIHGISRDSWYARGVANVICVPLIVLAIRSSPEKSFAIFVSRHVVFHTTAMIGVGGYLMLMALGGYYVRTMGGTWGRVAEISFLVVALSVLLFLVFSGQLRRRLAVFIAKHFYRNKYDYRIEWLRFIRTLSENTEGDVMRTAVRAVTQIFDSPGGILLMADDSGRSYTPVAAWPSTLDSLPFATEIPARHELIQFLQRRQWIVDLEEFVRTPELYENVLVPEWIGQTPGLRVVSPMMELDRLTGVFLLYSPPAPFKLTYEDRDLLKMVGQHVATQIGQHEADRKLAEGRQFEAYNKLTAFMMHDLKNSVAQLQLVVANAERHKANPAFIEDAISTIANAVRRMTHLIEHLQLKNDRPVLRPVSMDQMVASAVERCSQRKPVPRYLPVNTGVAVRADPERLEAILEHVIRNAQDASGPDQTVEVEIVSAEQEVTVSVADNGSGMTGTFIRERLFRPFDSTKGSKGMGIGAYQTREYVRMLGGDVKVQSSPGGGTRFSIILPCQETEADRLGSGVRPAPKRWSGSDA